MKIAMIGQKGIPAKYGGIEQHVQELSLRLVQAGQNVTVYSRKWYTEEGNQNFQGINVEITPNIHTKHLDAISHTFASTLDAIIQKYDIIHYHGVGPALLSWIPRIFAPHIKVVTTFHCIDRQHQKWGVFAKLMLRIGERAACKFAHETITVSRSLQNYCINEYNADTHYIPNGVTENTKTPGIINIEKIGLEPKNYFTMISRLVRHKGVHTLIHAFIRMKEMYPQDEKIQNMKLAIAGGSAFTDEYVEELHRMAEGRKDILFTGFISGDLLEELFAHAKTLVHPSLNEGLPLTVLQAMSYGTPSIVSDISEHRELIPTPEAFVPINDVYSLAQKMYEFAHMSEEQLSLMGEEQKEISRNLYSWDIITTTTLQLYEKKIDTRSIKERILKRA
ncbi:MAG: glycosyltransferase family 4 protein [Candidatus Magasanikbacteria bacterium]